MQILVTGAAGLIGSWVVRELVSSGHDVVALDNKPLPPDVRSNKVRTVYADIADPLAVLNAALGCDGIAHLAAFAGPWRVTNAELLRVNVTGTQNILDAAEAHAMERVVLTSSVGALGFSFPTLPCLPDYLPVDIDHPRRPQDIYGLSKLANEESAAAAARRTGLTTLVFRPPYVLDLEKAHAQGWLQRRVKHSLDQRDTSLWAYIDVRDQARAYRLALESSLTGYHRFYTMADDIMADATPTELAEKFLPGLVQQASNLEGKGFYDLKPTFDGLGFRAERFWREVVTG